MEFFQRINYRGKLEQISLLICKDYNIGKFVSNKLVMAGYEDFNFALETTKGKYFVKVFANNRKQKECERYINIMLKVIEKGIFFPKLYKSSQGYLHTLKVGGSRLRLCVMEYITGESFYFLRQKPEINEIRAITRQAALINSIKFKPEFIYDSWAITSFLEEFKKKGKYLAKEDLKNINPLVAESKKIMARRLPRCFVHGDMIVTNLMKDKKGKIWIIDFAVANHYPRVQELAILASNVLFDEKDKGKTKRNLEIALEKYQKIIKLTPQELKALPTYIKLAHAMFVLCANYEKMVENNSSEENEYWLAQGRAGLS